MGTPIKGRGALSSPQPRFVRTAVDALDDGWYTEDTGHSLATHVLPDAARTVISRNDSPDVPFSQSINPYRGCEHGCIYCFARPTHAYLDLSPGRDFETHLFYKVGAADLLRQELAHPSYRCEPITLGANTDPYQPIERRLEVTRSLLQVFVETHHPVTILTKSALILRDVDLLAQLAREQLVRVYVSLTSLDNELKRTLEPRTAAPVARLRVLRELTAAGVPCGVLIAPIIPMVNDAEVEQLLEAAVANGAKRAGYVLLRLPLEVAPLFREWLAAHLPERAAHVMSLVQSAHGGRDYDARFGQRMKGSGAWAELLRSRFALASRRLGLPSGPAPPLCTELFRSHSPGGQLRLEL
ncbi:MAG: PA0069 family radical SAM protein [Steroidobacteraceae bacterium]|jgi:DNA repair photolyase